MLLQFTVENLCCFAEETVFSMVADKDDQHPTHEVSLREGYKHKALRTAALYGANAHGKTKLVEAMALAQRLITKGCKPGQSIPVAPFRLDAEKRNQPSRLEFVIFHEGVEYTYGFVANSQRIMEEWLFARPKSQEVRYFERVTDEQGNTKVEFGPSLKRKEAGETQFLEFVARGTRENQLFLTEAVERNVKSVKPVYEWFDDVLTLVPTNLPMQPIELRACEESDFIDFMGDFLRLADTGISGIVTEEEKLDFERHLPGAPDAFRKKLENHLTKGRSVAVMAIAEGASSLSVRPGKDGPVLARLKTQHQDKQGEPVLFKVEEESSGTQRVMQILPILADLKAGNGVYVIDELDRKLHPLLSRLFVETFLERGKGQNCQLIFTTHETSLLNLDLLRRDEIWFVEKDQVGASHLYSLASLKIRPDLKIERGYLQGRFGAIPFIGDTRALGWPSS
ncbi:MAG: ATP/GTP-binding protein [Methylococcaceae bacterium]|nr:ATP/GTP-binding protein [Methylococcaceae bacterium]